MRSQTKITPSRLRRPITELGQRIASARIARQITQELMAQRCGVSRATIAKLESGDASVSADTLFRVLMVLGKDDDIGKLLGEDRVGYELAVGRLQRPTTRLIRKITEPADTGHNLPRNALMESARKRGLELAATAHKTVLPVASSVRPVKKVARSAGVSVTRTRPAARVKRPVPGVKE